MRNQLLLLALLIGTFAFGQPLPNTNIMLFDFNQLNDTVIELSNPKFITDFNKDGYNNQPYFMADNELYITAQMPDDSTQTDIYALDLETKSITRVTATVESEYSPTFVPPLGRAQSYEFSVVRVEEDGSQVLWKYPMNRKNEGKKVLENINNIGYHYWADYRDLAAFIVGEPHKMLLIDSRNQTSQYVTSNIGRCFQDLPDGSIAFVEKMAGDIWLLKKLNTRTLRTSLITATLSQSEDFVTLRDGTIIMSNGTALYKFNQRKDTTWRKIADLSYYGMKGITRMAINGAQNKLAIVIN